MSAVYRVQQGVRALLAFAHPPDERLATTYLNELQMALFHQLRRSEQLHSLNVLRTLLAQPQDTPHDLAVAALLHDAGKSRYPLAIWQKTLAVLARRFAPGLFRRWSQGDPVNPWQRACVVAVMHPAWSAELVASTGANERTLWLISQHAAPLVDWQGHPHYHMLKRLRAADDTN